MAKDYWIDHVNDALVGKSFNNDLVANAIYIAMRDTDSYLLWIGRLNLCFFHLKRIFAKINEFDTSKCVIGNLGWIKRLRFSTQMIGLHLKSLEYKSVEQGRQ